MTDRELLELAAKACGYGEVWHSTMHEHWYADIDGKSQPWNPLEDDGDAFRLAVKLDMAVTVNRVDDWTQVECGYFVTSVQTTKEPHDGDPYYATRRAIVRAAAEIGRAM